MKTIKYSFEQCIGSRLRSLSRKVDNVYRKHLEGCGVTENQLSILMALYKTGPIGQIEIGKFLHLERSSLSRNLVRLVDGGLVNKEGAVNRPTIALSAKGRQLVEFAAPAWEQAMDEVLAALDPKAVEGFGYFEKQINDS